MSDTETKEIEVDVPEEVAKAVELVTAHFRSLISENPKVVVVSEEGIALISEAGLRSMMDEVYERGISVAGGIAVERGAQDVAFAIMNYKATWREEDGREDKQLPLIVT